MSRTMAITRRIYRQLLRDTRFLALSVLVPLVIIFLLKVTLDALQPGGAAGLTNGYVMPIVATIAFFLAYLLCSIALVGERTRGTLTRMFICGYRRHEIILGYLLGFVGLATVQTALALIEANLIFSLDYPLSRQLSLFLVIWLLAIISVALGILFSTLARNEAQVLPFIPLVLLPSIFLSGVLTRGVNALPGWAQAISAVIPLRYASDIIQGLVGGGTLQGQAGELALLLGVGAVLLALSVGTLREYD